MLTECKAFLEYIKSSQEKFYTSNLVLSEINWLLKSFYHFTKTENLKMLHSITENPNIKVIKQVPNTAKALELYEKYNVKFIDTLLASYSDDFTIISYDRDFDKIGVKRLEPSDF